MKEGKVNYEELTSYTIRILEDLVTRKHRPT